MLFNVFNSLLLVPGILAIPSKLGVRIPLSHESYRSQTINHFVQDVGDPSNSEYSRNWAGGAWDMTKGTFASITGTFTVPFPSGSEGAAAAAWVGIDGDTCTTVILQTGVVFTVENGQAGYYAWYEWYPNVSHNFSGIAISAGDSVKLSVNTSTATSGNVTIENLSNGQTVSESLTSSVPLCGQNAEWIVEDYTQGTGLVPLANFSTITFTNAEATGDNGTYTPSGATLYEMRQNDQVLTSTSTGGSSITIQYV